MNNRIRQLRVEQNLSQQQLAKIINVTQQSINKYENGQSVPSIESLKAMAAYFDTSVDYLIEFTDVRERYECVDIENALTSTEHQLLKQYRNLTDSQKEGIQLFAEAKPDRQ